MGTEERWAQAREWAQERGEIEIKSRWVIGRGWAKRCEAVEECNGIATYGREIGSVQERFGLKGEFCEEHKDDESAFQAYRRAIGR